LARIEVQIDGKNDVMEHVEWLEFAEALDRLDALVVEVAIPKHGTASDLVTKIAPGKPYTVKLFDDDDAEVGSASGDVVEVGYGYVPGQGQRLTILGLDCLHRLHVTQPAKLWEASHSDIVKQIASRNGLTAKADGVSTTAGFVLQGDGSDGVFLRNLAREHNYVVRAVDKELHFKRATPAGGQVKVVWADDVREIKLRANVQNLVSKVTVHGFDPKQDKVIQGQATPAQLKKITGSDTGVALAKKAFGERELILNQAGYVAASNAKERAVAELQSRAERFVEGTVLVNGKPDARAGKKVQIKDAAWPFAGTFFIRQARHLFDGGGYRTAIDFSSDSLPSRS
jgi:phage protein D